MNSTITLEQVNTEENARLAPLLVFLGLVAVTGIPGNIIVCFVYGRSSRRSISHFFIWWLSVLDICSCFVLFLEIVNVVNQFTFTNAWLCKFTIFMTFWPVLSSGFALGLISIDRFRRVCRPLKVQISHKVARIMCAVTVGIAFLFSWPCLVLFGIYDSNIPNSNLTGSECHIQNRYQGTLYARVYNGFLWILFVSALIFLCVVYMIIGKKIFTQMENIANRKPGINTIAETVSGDDTTSETNFSRHKSNQSLCRTNQEIERKLSTFSKCSQSKISSTRQAKARRSAFIMFLISFVFAVSFTPYLILRLLEALDSTFVQSMSDSTRAVYKFFLRTYFLNCAVNPFIYCACAPTFRQKVRDCFNQVTSRLKCF